VSVGVPINGPSTICIVIYIIAEKGAAEEIRSI
jgi:hypothetical protein